MAEASATFFCWALIVAQLWSAAATTPQHDWNAARFYPAYLLAGNVPIYYVAHAGVVSGWIYGPILPIVLAPLTHISDPTWAMFAAGWLNLVVLIVPVMLAVDLVAAGSQSLLRRWLLAGAAVVVVLLLPTTSNRLVFLTVDQLAIGLGLLSCLMLHRALRPGERASRAGLAGAAFCSCLAVGTKQTELLLPLGQLTYLGWSGQSRQALRYGIWLAGVSALVVADLIWRFGWDELRFNVYWIPAHHPLEDGLESLWSSAARLAGDLLPLGLVCLWLGRLPASGGQRDDADRLARQLVFVGLGLAPFGILAAAKDGGNVNSFHSIYFVATAGLVLASHRLPAQAWVVRGRLVPLLCLGTILGIVISQQTAAFRLWPASELRESLDLAKSAPRHIYFPRNPLVAWLAEGKQTHLEYGVYDQYLAGIPPTRADFARGLPEQLTLIAYPMPGPHYLLQLLPPVTHVHRAGSLYVYTLAGPPR